MQGIRVFADAPRPGADPRALAAALDLDAYRARLLTTAAAPIVTQPLGNASTARRIVEALDAAGFPASAHDGSALASVPNAVDVVGLEADGSVPTFLDASGARHPIDGSCLRAVVEGKVTFKVEVEVPGTRPLRFGHGLEEAVAALRDRTRTEERANTVVRLEVFVAGGDNTARFGLASNAFDFRGLGDRKGLSAVRNVAVLRELLARSGSGVVSDDAFHRTELARTSFAPDVWLEVDLGSGSPRSVTARSNRAALDLYARLRYLHDAARRQPSSPHFYEF